MIKKIFAVIVVAILFQLLFATSSIVCGQSIEIPKFSIYVDGKYISSPDPELTINNRIVKKGVIYSIKYQKKRCKSIVYHHELCNVDSIEIKISTFAKKKDINVIAASKYNTQRWLLRCLRCKEGYRRSEIILYESVKD